MGLTVELPTERGEDGEERFAYAEVSIRDGDFVAPDRFALCHTPDGEEPGWRMEFVVRQGVPQCRKIIIEAGEHGREVRSADLRFKVEDLLELAARNVATRVVVGPDGRKTYARDVADVRSGASLRAVRAARRASRRKITEDVLREVAEVYRRHLGGNPTEAVRLRLGVADRTARLYVRRARDAGLLGEAIHGKAGER